MWLKKWKLAISLKTLSTNKNKIIAWLLAGIFVILVASSIWAVTNTFLSWRALRSLKFSEAAAKANSARPVVFFWSTLTLRQIPDLEAWRLALNAIPQVNTLLTTDLPELTTNGASQSGIDLTQLNFHLDQLVTDAQHLSSIWSKTWWLQKANPGVSPDRWLAHLLSSQQMIKYLSQEPRRVLVIFQNSQEIRATGGFMGSYALLDIANSQPINIDIQDIYVPDGQFTGYVEAPPGVNEYLSAGKGWRLPDSNWDSDYPTSAQNILRFMSLGKISDIDLVVSVNLALAQDVLAIIGPIELPDFQTTVTSENLAQVARADRGQFFPGSQQKSHFLSVLINKLRYQFSTVSNDQKKEVAQLLLKRLNTKDIQVFSTDEKIQQLIAQSSLSGQISLGEAGLMLVESNVGINKANQNISRQVVLKLDDYRTNVEVEFSNHNSTLGSLTNQDAPETNLHYANYQRVLVPATYQIASITIDGQVQTDFSQRELELSNGEKVWEIGVLCGVKESDSLTLSFEFNHPRQSTKSFKLLKQSGIPNSPYKIIYQGKIQDLLLDKDQIINLEV